MKSRMASSLEPGLYIVATPIGNRGDITLRAIETLRGAAAIACEDTRVTGQLLRMLDIRNRLLRYDDHADEEARERLLVLAREAPVALVSDAGMPLISDPGYRLVREARESGVEVHAVPGASALTAAVAVSGLPSDRFLFAGFLPAKAKARADMLAEFAGLDATLVFYESGPRLLASLEAIASAFPEREVAVARELTKLHEECRRGTAGRLAEHFGAHPPKGEIVLLIGPPATSEGEVSEAEVDGLLQEALQTAKPSQAAAQVAKATGRDRKALYARALELK